MALAFSRRKKTPSEVVAEAINVDVTPVMNVFIILIPFLVSMAVFTQLSIIEFSLPPNVGTNLDPSEGKPKLKITVVVSKGYLGITQADAMLDSIAIVDDDYDYAVLRKQLVVRREAADVKDEIVVAVQDIIRFDKVVKVMDACRESGFEKVGLSSAPEGAEVLR